MDTQHKITENLPLYSFDPHTAILSSQGALSIFSYGDQVIKFRTPECLERYEHIVNWDNGYITVLALYKGLGLTEEYIYLTPILNNLYIDPKSFLEPIKKVEIRYE
ncbi:MAG: hypothetical protein LIP03_13985 [Bacteroidales bacterium]|nr:hypothetical protein [Bacteroidales bacterium]